MTTLPLGSLPIQAVFADKASHSNDAFLIRSNDAVRSAQLRDNLNPDEMTFLYLHLQESFPGQSIDVIVQKIMAQYAAIAFLGSEFTSSADNILLNGKILDEESWIWPERMGQLRMVVSFKSNAKSIPKQTIDWENIQDPMSSFEIVDKAIQRLLKALSFFSPEVPSLKESRSMFLAHFIALFSVNKKLEKKWIQKLWSDSLTLSEMNSLELKRWSDDLTKQGFKLSVQQTKRKGHFVLEITSPDYLASKQRPYGYSRRFEELQKMRSLDTDLFQLNATILSLITRNAHLLPFGPDEFTGKPVPNQKPLSKWWEEEMFRLNSIKKKIIAFNVLENGQPKKVKLHNGQAPRFHSFVEPISFDYELDQDRIMEIPAKKTLLING